MIRRNRLLLLWAFGAGIASLVAAAPNDRTMSAPSQYFGMCDASAAVALNESFFAVANDEDNVIRLFRLGERSLPLARFDLSAFLRVDPEEPETDLEGAAWLGDRIFWITSHGRNKNAKFRSSRHRFFATKVEGTGSQCRLVPEPQPYSALLQDMLRDSRLRPFNLAAAARKAPKDPGALNIEGLCATPDGRLLIGFRNPIPERRALIVPLLNPTEVITGRRARFGAPILLDLGGYGVRDLALWQEQYFIVAGPHDGSEAVSRLYLWDGKSAPQRLEIPGLGDLNPEAIVIYPGRDQRIQLLSDDGTREVGGKKCKTLSDPALKSFRGVQLTLPELKEASKPGRTESD